MKGFEKRSQWGGIVGVGWWAGLKGGKEVDGSLTLSEGIVFQPYEWRILRVRAGGFCLRRGNLGFDEMGRWVVRSRLRNERSFIPSFRMRLLVSVSRLV